jgi:hypothetical protein
VPLYRRQFLAEVTAALNEVGSEEKKKSITPRKASPSCCKRQPPCHVCPTEREMRRQRREEAKAAMRLLREENA